MDIPQLDFLGDKKPLVIGGSLVLITVFVLGQRRGKESAEPMQQTATLVPPEGTSWDALMQRARQGVFGVVGPGEPVPGPKGDTGPTGPAGQSGTDTTVVVNADWLKISFAGRTGYVHAAYVTNNTVNTPGSCLRFRTAADYNAPEITCIQHGTKLTVVGSVAGTTPSSVTPPTNTTTPPSTTTGNTSGTVKDGYTWVKVTYNGKSGYVASSYLCGNSVCKTGGAGLRLRANPGLNAPVILTIPEGGTVSRSAAGEGPNPNPGGTIRSLWPMPAPIPSQRTITVKRGDTLRSLAARGYGAGGWWEYLARTNPDKREVIEGDTWRL